MFQSKEKALCRVGEIRLLKCDAIVKKHIRIALYLEDKKNPTLYQVKKMLLQKKVHFINKNDSYSRKEIERIDSALNYLKLVKVTKITGGKVNNTQYY